MVTLLLIGTTEEALTGYQAMAVATSVTTDIDINDNNVIQNHYIIVSYFSHVCKYFYH